MRTGKGVLWDWSKSAVCHQKIRGLVERNSYTMWAVQQWGNRQRRGGGDAAPKTVADRRWEQALSSNRKRQIGTSYSPLIASCVAGKCVTLPQRRRKRKERERERACVCVCVCVCGFNSSQSCAVSNVQQLPKLCSVGATAKGRQYAEAWQ